MVNINTKFMDKTEPQRGQSDAQVGWHEEEAEHLAREEGIDVVADRREDLRALQEYSAKHDKLDLNVRELHDALDECFHTRGGLRYLYKLFPGGPVAQGCRLPCLSIPAGAVDKLFGSVQEGSCMRRYGLVWVG